MGARGQGKEQAREESRGARGGRARGGKMVFGENDGRCDGDEGERRGGNEGGMVACRMPVRVSSSLPGGPLTSTSS